MIIDTALDLLTIAICMITAITWVLIYVGIRLFNVNIYYGTIKATLGNIAIWSLLYVATMCMIAYALLPAIL